MHLAIEHVNSVHANKCIKCGADCKPKKCSRCKVIGYCGANCQRADWPQHSKICRPEMEQLLIGSFKKLDRIGANNIANIVITSLIQLCAANNHGLALRFTTPVGDEKYFCQFNVNGATSTVTREIPEDFQSMVCVKLLKFSNIGCVIIKEIGSGAMVIETELFKGAVEESPNLKKIVDSIYPALDHFHLLISEEYFGAILSAMQ